MNIISILNLFRKERIKGKVLDKYQYESGNIGLIVEDERTGKRYSVEFRTDYIKPGWENLYRIISEPFKGKKEYLDQLIEKESYVELTTSYSKEPIKHAYFLHAVSRKPYYKPKPKKYRRIAYQPAGSY